MTGGQRRVTVLGATGSIGRSTARVLEELGVGPEAPFAVEAIAGGRDVAALADMAVRLRPRFVAAADPNAGEALRAALAAAGVDAASGAGPAAIEEAAARPSEWVMSAVVGAAALSPTLAALRRGATVALANKECLVCAGALVMAEAARSGGRILPVDSEHNAIFQVLHRPERVERLTLTASGGPFRTKSLAEMATATPEQALKHPNWAMGAKNTIDSATLMNKGLELIEAAVLFDMTDERLSVLVHPQSIIHALVTYCDGSVLAQLAAPDMRIPIAHALAWPDRAPLDTPRLDLAQVAQLTFETPDMARFPALASARQALREGGGAPTVLNAANEIAVEAFLGGRIGFLEIAQVVAETLDDSATAAQDGAPPVGKTPCSFDEVNALDSWARRRAQSSVSARS